jgi:hypothetical protein
MPNLPGAIRFSSFAAWLWCGVKNDIVNSGPLVSILTSTRWLSRLVRRSLNVEAALEVIRPTTEISSPSTGSATSSSSLVLT